MMNDPEYIVIEDFSTTSSRRGLLRPPADDTGIIQPRSAPDLSRRRLSVPTERRRHHPHTLAGTDTVWLTTEGRQWTPYGPFGRRVKELLTQCPRTVTALTMVVTREGLNSHHRRSARSEITRLQSLGYLERVT